MKSYTRANYTYMPEQCVKHVLFYISEINVFHSLLDWDRVYGTLGGHIFITEPIHRSYLRTRQRRRPHRIWIPGMRARRLDNTPFFIISTL